MNAFADLVAKLRAGRARPRPEGAPAAADLVRKTVRAGRVELPILNLAGLWALQAISRDGDDDAGNLLRILWVLRHQSTDRILSAAAEPPAAAELAAVGREIDLAALGDYVAALEEMLALVSKKKTGAATSPATTAPPSSNF